VPGVPSSTLGTPGRRRSRQFGLQRAARLDQQTEAVVVPDAGVQDCRVEQIPAGDGRDHGSLSLPDDQQSLVLKGLECLAHDHAADAELLVGRPLTMASMRSSVTVAASRAGRRCFVRSASLMRGELGNLSLSPESC
jgi:hypothetical protein